MPILVVFSHLRWSLVQQRPEHVLKCLAQHYRVLYVEQPVFGGGTSRLQVRDVATNIRVVCFHTPVNCAGFDDRQIPMLHQLMQTLIDSEGIKECVAWLHTPMALPLVDDLRPRTIVYDCSDAASACADAPHEFAQREDALLKVADVVFAGSRGLYRSLRARHGNVHYLPDSVDREHFAAAGDANDAHELLRDVPRPRLGFSGVIDERVDLGLIEQLAAARPDWHIVMVGPVMKIGPQGLPQAPNIHYLGPRPYAELPQFLAGCDVCLLPYAVNEGTRMLSPSGMLEYLAAERPTVSTAIPEVMETYGYAISVADCAADFAAACESAISEAPEQRARRIAASRQAVEQTSWERTAAKMHSLIEQARAGSAADRQGATSSAGALSRTLRSRVSPAHARGFGCVVMGAGPTGLSAAYHLGADALLLEQHATVGGWCRSVEDRGFTFDYASHMVFTCDRYVLDLYKILLGDNMHWQDTEAWVCDENGTYSRHPMEVDSPPRVAEKCVVGPLQPRFAYPLHHGLQALMNGFVPLLQGELRLASKIACVAPAHHLLKMADGTRYEYDYLLNTLPLAELVRLSGSEAPPLVRRAASALRHVSVRLVHIGVGRPSSSDKHLIYYPQDAVFQRIFMQSNASPYCAPPGSFGLTCEIAYSERTPLPCDGAALIQRCVDDCIRVGMLRADDKIVTARQVDVPFAYVACDAARARNVEVIANWAADFDIVLADRYSAWQYFNSDHAFAAGKRAAEQVLNDRAPRRAPLVRIA